MSNPDSHSQSSFPLHWDADLWRAISLVGHDSVPGHLELSIVMVNIMFPKKGGVKLTVALIRTVHIIRTFKQVS